LSSTASSSGPRRVGKNKKVDREESRLLPNVEVKQVVSKHLQELEFEFAILGRIQNAKHAGSSGKSRLEVASLRFRGAETVICASLIHLRH